VRLLAALVRDMTHGVVTPPHRPRKMERLSKDGASLGKDAKRES
jgi:hypothetical protein